MYWYTLRIQNWANYIDQLMLKPFCKHNYTVGETVIDYSICGTRSILHVSNYAVSLLYLLPRVCAISALYISRISTQKVRNIHATEATHFCLPVGPSCWNKDCCKRMVSRFNVTWSIQWATSTRLSVHNSQERKGMSASFPHNQCASIKLKASQTTHWTNGSTQNWSINWCHFMGFFDRHWLKS